MATIEEWFAIFLYCSEVKQQSGRKGPGNLLSSFLEFEEIYIWWESILKIIG